jgi:hypothetical protein
VGSVLSLAAGMHPGIPDWPPTHGMNHPVLSCAFVMLNIEQAWTRGLRPFRLGSNYSHWRSNLPISHKFEPKSCEEADRDDESGEDPQVDIGELGS